MQIGTSLLLDQHAKGEINREVYEATRHDLLALAAFVTYGRWRF